MTGPSENSGHEQLNNLTQPHMGDRELQRARLDVGNASSNLIKDTLGGQFNASATEGPWGLEITMEFMGPGYPYETPDKIARELHMLTCTQYQT